MYDHGVQTYEPASTRYENPRGWFRKCGRSGLYLPAISLGCWQNFGDPGTDSARTTDEGLFHENVRSMIFTAFDHGVTHFDLANNYGPQAGAAERRVGRVLNEDLKAHRDELLISTKAGYGMWPGPYGDGGSRKYLLASLDQSLLRMGLDYVDIFYSHRPDPDVPLEETLGALDTAVKQGKALYAGISSYSGALTRESIEVCRQDHLVKPIIHQPSYSMLNRGIEKDLIPVAKEEGMGVIAFCPLASGVLTSKYLDGIPSDSRATQWDSLRDDVTSVETSTRLKQLNELAKRRGQTLSQLALSWVLRNPIVTSALIGASRPSQIAENVAAAENLSFADEELATIDAILATPITFQTRKR